MSFSNDDKWPEKAPNANLGYAINLTGELDEGDVPTHALVYISPSGDGELKVSAPQSTDPISLSGNTLIIWFAGGVAARQYLVRVVVNTLRGATLEMYVTMPMVRTQAVFPPLEPATYSEQSPPYEWTAPA